MALSRFWLSIVIVSILFVLALLLTGRLYSIDGLVNGKKDDLIVRREVYLQNLRPEIKDSLSAHNGKYTVNDSLYSIDNNIVTISKGKQLSDGILPTCKSTVFDLVLPLAAYLAFFCGLLQLLIDSGAAQKLAHFLSPIFLRIFPDVPKNHPAISYMMLNFAANFLGLDSAATPFGLKAMESLQELNTSKDKASNPQIMFMCLHAAGLTLMPTSIIGYRAAQNAHNPADVMLPCIITSFAGTVAALIIVGIRQKINLLNALLISAIGGVIGLIVALMYYISRLDAIGKSHFTGNISNVILLSIILLVLGYAFLKEKKFSDAGKNVFGSFVEGAASGLQTGVTIFPYILGMLVAISLFRNSGVFDLLSGGVSRFFLYFHVRKDIVDALPVAILRPFSSSGSRGFMIDAMKAYGADSFTGRLSSVFQCSAETTFYVIAVYFGSIKIKNVRYALSTMLLVDLVCVITAAFVCLLFF